MRHIIMCPARVLPCSQPVSHGRGLRCCAAGVTGGFAGGERGVQQYVEEGDIKLAPPGRGASPSHMALRACMHAVPGRGARAHLTWHREHATHACDPGRVMHALLAGGWEHASMCPCRWSARVPQGSCASYLYGVCWTSPADHRMLPRRPAVQPADHCGRGGAGRLSRRPAAGRRREAGRGGRRERECQGCL